MSAAHDDITTLLAALRNGDRTVEDKLVRLVHGELRQRAAGHMARERADHTLQPTALVNEAWLKLMAGEGLASLENRAHFFAAAAQAMRQILVDHARARRAEKRGGRRKRVPLDDVLDDVEREFGDMLELNEALDLLAVRHPRPYRVIQLACFAESRQQQIAEELSISVGTVEKDKRFARAFLKAQLSDDGGKNV